MNVAISIPQPRFPVALTPTPLERLPRIGRRLGIQLHVKRDDLTGFAFGGNKLRQLEYYLGEALASEATVVLVTGAVQSNYVRATAAVAARAGLRCHVQLEDRVPGMEDAAYRRSGNVLLTGIYGATVSHFGEGNDEAAAHAAILETAQALRHEGERPYIIPLLARSRALGALGYLHCAAELLAQRPTLTDIVVCSGSGQTQAGLLFGLRLLGSTARVHGCSARRDAIEQRRRVAGHCASVAELLGVTSPVTRDDVRVSDSALGAGYGLADQDTLGTIMAVARDDGLLLDPVYTAKAFRGLLDACHEGAIPSGADVAFIHTGGMPALFAYGSEIEAHLREARADDMTPARSVPGAQLRPFQE